MDFYNNPVANMSGVYFLLFYVLVLAGLLIVGFLVALSLDRTRRMPPLAVPEKPNPYEIAFLRGEESEVLKLMVVDLYHRGILVQTPRRILSKPKFQLAEGVDLEKLDPALHKLAQRFITPRPIVTLNSSVVRSSIGEAVDKWRQWVRDERLRTDEFDVMVSNYLACSLAAILLALGGYKLFIAFQKNHHNIGFLVFLMIAGTAAIIAVTRLRKFTTRGQRYLEDLQAAYRSLQVAKLPQPQTYIAEATPAPVSDPLLAGSFAMPVLAMGLFGSSAMVTQDYRCFREQFNQHSTGSSCGSASCSGGGCGGGGGGGCGGGGCGGCGS